MIPDIEHGQCYLVYDAGTGRPQYTVEFPAPEGMKEVFEENNQSVAVAEAGVVLTKVYVSNGVVTPRPDMGMSWRNGKNTIAADGVDTCYLDSVPEGAVVRVDGFEITREPGNVVEFAADTRGRYRVEVDLWPYLEGGAFFDAE